MRKRTAFFALKFLFYLMKSFFKLIVVLILVAVAFAGVSIYQNGLKNFQSQLRHLAFEAGNFLENSGTASSATAKQAPAAPEKKNAASLATAPAPQAEKAQPIDSIIPQAKMSEPQRKTDVMRDETLASLQSSRQDWPLRITNKIPLAVPLVANGRVIGKMNAPVGSPLAIQSVNGETVTVIYRGGTAEIAVDNTDLIERAEALRKLRGQAAAPTPAPLRVARPSPPNGLDSSAPGVDSGPHYFGKPAGE